MADKKSNYGVKRLQSKTAKDAIVQKLSTDFNLTPIIAQKSERIIREYEELYQDYQEVHNQQLQELLSPVKSNEKKRATKPHE